MSTDLKNIIQELKRRRVFRVAAVYSGFAFIVFQIIDATFDTLGIPQWLGKYTIIALVLGFPIAVGLGWAFDITDKGLVRTRGKAIEHDSRKPFVGNVTLSIVASVAILLAIWGWMKTPEVRSEGYQSIAVLPFDNYMGDTTQDYFVDGMTEAIIAELARLEGLKVISRTSVMGYRNTEKRLTDIARELGVDAIVEGSVLKAGNEVRITAQLIDGLTDEHLWANSFDRGMDQVLSLQREVAGAIAKQIKWTFHPEEESYFQETDPVNSEAYELYLKGWQHRLAETPASINKAISYFDAAIALDSSLYQAHAAKVVTYFLSNGPNFSQKVKQAVDASFRLDPEAPETQMALAMYKQIYALDIQGARDAFMRVLSLRPGDAEVRREYGLFLSRLGQFEDALVQLDISRAYDPLSALSLRDLGMIKLRLGMGQEGIDLIRQSMEIDPDNNMVKQYLPMAYLVMNEAEEAHRLNLELRAEGIRYPGTISISAIRAGHAKRFRSEIDSFLRETDPSHLWPLLHAHSILGNLDAAVAILKQMVKERRPVLIFLHETPNFDKLRHRPEYKQAIREIGFPQNQPESFSDMLERLHGPAPN